MGWILLFSLCCFCVFLWLHAVYGMPTMMAAKSMFVFLKEEICLYYQYGIFFRRDRIIENMSLILLIPIHLRNIYSFSVNHVFLPV